ncbi:aminoglycoside phosphotransferase [Pseudomonas neustonica]|uniref:Aminoglycoside phosphotransferase n=2 Tax=Pseudomonas TaxID=286 RepID=A0ABX9XKQ1_9PSED|nr:aminoglycoside phosphotransferase [Pseudomonas sp. SSM44]ROZ87383.1 aminoglycoside phosphotransferase [Pseudomonas neustonica]
MDTRMTQLEGWLPAALAEGFTRMGWQGIPSGQLAPASADASFRRYFRWQSAERSLIVMDAPPEHEDSTPFVRIAALLEAAGVRVPRILASDLQQGFLLLEDMGAKTFLQSIESGVTAAQLEQMFSSAIDTLVLWQLASQPGVLPPYDEAVLRRELALFPDWYVARELGRSFNAHEQADWDQLQALLLESNLGEAQVFVHRDYMPRNLMTAEAAPGVLDFQDALYGPASYDATSLFADAFFSWTPAERKSWLTRYWTQALAAGVPLPRELEVFLDQARLMGVQRHLKVLGIFARICHRDGKSHYLRDAPRFVRYLRDACADDVRLQPLQRLLDSLGLAA